jgi:hypothetical protein
MDVKFEFPTFALDSLIILKIIKIMLRKKIKNVYEELLLSTKNRIKPIVSYLEGITQSLGSIEKKITGLEREVANLREEFFKFAKQPRFNNPPKFENQQKFSNPNSNQGSNRTTFGNQPKFSEQSKFSNHPKFTNNIARNDTPAIKDIHGNIVPPREIMSVRGHESSTRNMRKCRAWGCMEKPVQNGCCTKHLNGFGKRGKEKSAQNV